MANIQHYADDIVLFICTASLSDALQKTSARNILQSQLKLVLNANKSNRVLVPAKLQKIKTVFMWDVRAR